MGLLGVGLLLAIYVALTFLIVRPLDELGRAARRVTQGTRPLEVPRLPARELASLGRSLEVMTERLLAEEQALKTRITEVHETNERLKHAQERLLRSERLASVGRLAAGLAHELGNPISAMLGLEELLIQGGLTPTEERDFVQRIHRETERVHRILRDLLDFARPSTTSSQNESEEPGDVLKAIEETLALVRPQKAFRELRVTTALPPVLPLVTLARPKLVQVLLNLLLNAADALPRTGEVRIVAEVSTPTEIALAVEDDGPGVTSAIREHLFEPFVTTKDIGKGTGLGLAVCRGLIEGAGGSIALDERYERGARFIVKLPRASLTCDPT
jgi:signal transduction histidine kinase